MRFYSSYTKILGGDVTEKDQRLWGDKKIINKRSNVK